MKIKNLFRRKSKPAQKNRPTPVGANQLNQVDNNTKRMVLSMLTTYPQSRYILASAIGISERTFRNAVRQLRLEGNLIISESSVKGYRLGTAKEAQATARELESRAYNMLKTARAMKGVDPNQLTLEEVMNL